eukprot:1159336-Pelagomonas_calceolata.AAC.1
MATGTRQHQLSPSTHSLAAYSTLFFDWQQMHTSWEYLDSRLRLLRPIENNACVTLDVYCIEKAQNPERAEFNAARLGPHSPRRDGDRTHDTRLVGEELSQYIRWDGLIAVNWSISQFV